MKGGDISNQTSPLIILDIDGIIIKETERTEGLLKGIYEIPQRILRSISYMDEVEREVNSYEIIYEINPILERIIYNTDYSIGLFAHRPKLYKRFLEEKLEGLVFNKMYVGGAKDRELILSPRHVVLYYYINPLHASTLHKAKEKRIKNWNDVSL